MKLLAILFVSLSVLAACGGPAEEPAPAPEPTEQAAAEPAQPAMTYPEIMEMVAENRRALQENIEGGNATAAAEAAMKLEELFRDAIPELQTRGLNGAVEIANTAIAAAGEAAAAAQANDMEAALTAHGNVQSQCGACHSQYREKAPDGSYQFKAQ